MRRPTSSRDGRCDLLDDRRGVLVRLTAEGKDAVDGAFTALLTAERDLLADLPPSAQQDLAGLLRRLLAPFGSD